MDVTYSDRAKQWADGSWLLERTTKQLQDMAGPSSALVQAEWDCDQDARGRPICTLRLSDWTGAVSAAFTPDELRSPSELRYRLIRLWGDLLQLRSHKQLQKLLEPTGQAEE